ncbi:efflux RND transporter periplasmic adaptor subunit [Flavobacterium sp.]|uniref:efflux RND transporter periplasmic adaptor subunit n=1 Tax=Flavobacterium sp. TaxID=239 RepID=UPI00286CF712|nr:efflux RND transporter periplasmic adaptor subunit [Flavobacterium sp.]
MKNIFIIIISFIVISCKKEIQESKTEIVLKENEVSLTDAQMKNANIETISMSEKSISSVLKINGKIDVPPQNLVSVSVPLGGYLRSTKLLPGMHVNKGEVIAVMEDQQYIQLQQDYLVSKAKLVYAEKESARQNDLNQSQASSDKVTQMAQAEVLSLRAMTNGLAEKLRLININPNTISASKISQKINILATINGFVSKVNVNIGKYISPSEVMFELINPTDIHLNIKVYEKDVAKLKIGQKIIAYTNAEPNKKHECEIILISKDVSADGTSEVHCHFEDYDKTLLPGMYMNAEVELNSSNSNTLPEESIINFEGKDYVYIEIANQKYQMIEVQIGEKENGFLQILNVIDLRNKKIVSQGAYTLLMKMKNTEEE